MPTSAVPVEAPAGHGTSAGVIRFCGSCAERTAAPVSATASTATLNASFASFNFPAFQLSTSNF